MDGVFLSPKEDEFVGRITQELEEFMLQGQHHRVLLFPPLSSRLRYLIHRTVENVDLLSSFSVGEGWRRRTVICHSAVRLPSEINDQKPSTNPPRPQRPPQPWSRGGRGGRTRHGGEILGDNSRACVGSGRIKRPPWKKPDKALYVPKAMRKKEDCGERGTPVMVTAATSGEEGAQEEGICPPASLRATQEELGMTGGSPGSVFVALGKQQEPGEECVGGREEEQEEDVPSLEDNKDFFSGQPSEDKDCSGSLSAQNKKPSEAEEQGQSCAKTPEGTKPLCHLQTEDQSSQSALECPKTSSLTQGCSSDSCVGLSAAELSSTSQGLENQGESCAAAKSLESSSNVSLPEGEGKDLGNTRMEGRERSSQLENQDEECPSVGQNPPEPPKEASEPIRGASEEQSECWEDAAVQNHSGKVEEGEEKCPGLAEELWQELHLAAGSREESRHGMEEDCPAELFAEILGHLTVKDISIERISVDYSSYGDAQLNEGDFGHVTEIYDFSPSLKTEHLLEMFSDFHESGFKIQWVDDTHALGIFSSSSAASQALGRRFPSLKIRPLIHATKQSKIKALQRPKLLHLAKERPQTDTAVAKRLVTRALGLKHKQQDSSGTEMLLPENLDQEE
ncbi:R3H and coiled-coil domain-containing protein 1 [Calypte anna]|uniref:R3H and coiled-coil domain-containing protein 1 n=1 Tax=Calypte anna TaxID=9244 RepID=UPI0011C3F65D|nr:R3H and coiled-coil domain-containing protein 1 [Calypte anna]XP_030320054.1 R3H and coiled-coil domain-containing protein 1 [Calypte anna]